jgi:hypothetical protein
VVLSRQQSQQQRQRGPAGDSQILVIDFSTIDVDALRPSRLLRCVGGCPCCFGRRSARLFAALA